MKLSNIERSMIIVALTEFRKSHSNLEECKEFVDLGFMLANSNFEVIVNERGANTDGNNIVK